MPIYEYRCEECRRKVSLFFGSFSVAERRNETGEIECPRCGSKKLERLMSRVNMVRGEDALSEDSMPDMDGGEGMFDGLEDDDPRSVARWARRMKDSLGGEMDMGPEFDQALARIEAGEDPDKVMEDIDPEVVGGMSGTDGDDALDDLDDDFGPESIGL
jgi:putative FmdB family regulatory protein